MLTFSGYKVLLLMKDIKSSSSEIRMSSAIDAVYPSAGYGWYVVVILYLCYTFSFVDRTIIGYLVEPIKAGLHINDTYFSLLSGLSFVAFYAFLGIPVGRLADSRSRRNLLLAGVGLWSLMTVFCGHASTYWELFFARMGVGIGEACLLPCAYSLISDYFPREKRSLPLTIFSGGIMLGSGVANVCGGLVAHYARSGGPKIIFLFGLVQPWQLSFIMVGLPGIFIIAAIATIREPGRHERRGLPNSAQMFAYFLKHFDTFLSLIGGMTFGAMTNGAMLGWAPVWLERRFGWANDRIGTFLGITIFVFGTVGLMLAGALANKYIRAGKKAVYTKLMMTAEILVIIPLILATIYDNPYWMLCCIGGTIFFGGVSGGLGPASLQSITPNEMRGQITAISFLILNLVAGTLGMTLVGLLTDYVFINAKSVNSAAVIVGIFASIMGVLSLRLGQAAYERTAGENRGL
jgi:MFS family permease